MISFYGTVFFVEESTFPAQEIKEVFSALASVQCSLAAVPASLWGTQ